ncbi:MAG: hypothetical protein ACOYNZ_11905 [Rhodoferax sp.]
MRCRYLAGAEINSPRFERLAKYTLACGDSVGRIAAQCGVKTLALTHQRPRPDDAMVEVLRQEVQREFIGRVVVVCDLDEVVLEVG